MNHQIRESDWKLFSQLRSLALDRFCERVLAEVLRLIAGADKSNHERYLALFKLLKQRDEVLANAFNAPRRSAALVQLGRIQSQELLSPEEFARFSPETRAAAEAYLEMWRTQKAR